MIKAAGGRILESSMSRYSERRTGDPSTKGGVKSWTRRVSVCSAVRRFIVGQRMNAYMF